MELGVTTPALLFPAISLLLLAYTNRFLALAKLVRELKNQYKSGDEEAKALKPQISNLRKRIHIIQRTQEFGAVSFFLCVCCMFALYAGQTLFGSILFGGSILLLAISLALSIAEIHISVRALDLHLCDVEEQCD